MQINKKLSSVSQFKKNVVDYNILHFTCKTVKPWSNLAGSLGKTTNYCHCKPCLLKYIPIKLYFPSSTSQTPCMHYSVEFLIHRPYRSFCKFTERLDISANVRSPIMVRFCISDYRRFLLNVLCMKP